MLKPITHDYSLFPIAAFLHLLCYKRQHLHCVSEYLLFFKHLRTVLFPLRLRFWQNQTE